MANNLDQKLHCQPLVEKEHTFLATYSDSIKLLLFDAIYFSLRTQTHDCKQRSQKVTTSSVTNSDILTMIIEDERVNNTRDCDQCNQQLYAP